MNQPPLYIVELLVAAYPEAIEEQDKVGRLPLHTACSNKASLEVIEYLLELYPGSVFETTDRGVRCLGPLELVNSRISFLFSELGPFLRTGEQGAFRSRQALDQ